MAEEILAVIIVQGKTSALYENIYVFRSVFQHEYS